MRKTLKDILIPHGSAEVAPSILAADFARLGEEVGNVAAAGAKILHLDVMDGHLVPNLSIGTPVIESLRKVSDLIFDTHLMITNPGKFVIPFREVGSDHITFHLESEDDPDEVISLIHSCGASAGISIRPQTEVEKIFPYLDELDLVLIMSVEPGFGGQEFRTDSLERLSILRTEIARRNLPTKIEIDGGITSDNARSAIEAGAQILVAGSSVFRNPGGIAAGIQGLVER